MVLSNLGGVCKDSGKTDKAIAINEKCYIIRQQFYAKDPEQRKDYYLGIMNHLKEYYGLAGNQPKAEEFAEKIKQVKGE